MEIIFYSLMIVSHFGQFVLGNNNFIVIGLPVIPFFSLMIAQGHRLTKDNTMYSTRILIISVLSEYFFRILTGYSFNDIIGLFVGLLLINVFSAGYKKNNYKILIYLLISYALSKISFKLTYICTWILFFDVVLDYREIRVPRLLKSKCLYLNYLIYPAHLLVLIGIKVNL